MNRMTATVLILLAVLGLSACAYRDTDNPMVRGLSWFSYLNGDDIRTACGPGSKEQYRFVYNGIYVEQVRAYDVRPGLGGHGLKVQVLGPADLGRLSFSQSFDVLDPWRGDTASRSMSADDVARLKRAMRKSGVFDGAPKGLSLHSDRFYWMVSACSGGVFFFNAYLWPSDRFNNAVFPPLLFRWDQTGVPVNPPRQATTFEIHGDSRARDATRFNMKVGEDGLLWVRPLF